MVLKRKRSESELSFSSSSAFSSPTRLDQFSAMDIDTSPIRMSSSSRSSTPAHLHSRTLKRFRDSRPSDEEIHQRTLNMLYTAQKQHIAHQTQQQHFQLTHNALAAQPPRPQAQVQAQASLHNFWKLPTSSAAPASVPGTTTLALIDHAAYSEGPANCEDCGQTLREGGGSGDEAMDVDGFGAESSTGCGSCGKHVCSHCSITNLGEQRRCLICAGKKVWVGGLGWAGIQSLKVC
ncbi:uncharacterized protein F4807DRAFT_445759 [Annulohypoxylon truncatum]|uniref:uncharacterized protein n=1 Tax=Annulohypoxylon truncatum TaxID=327061 RepID=UPI00200820D1|nr:uncharacterized protein F4807DRAFT_445759 [Annulohypoxylon truncatum]KAI1204808.1 hypothetical protein F4807DRAFT_445759 [Annulohypoxylon truncatum]